MHGRGHGHVAEVDADGDHAAGDAYGRGVRQHGGIGGHIETTDIADLADVDVVADGGLRAAVDGAFTEGHAQGDAADSAVAHFQFEILHAGCGNADAVGRNDRRAVSDRGLAGAVVVDHTDRRADAHQSARDGEPDDRQILVHVASHGDRAPRGQDPAGRRRDVGGHVEHADARAAADQPARHTAGHGEDVEFLVGLHVDAVARGRRAAAFDDGRGAAYRRRGVIEFVGDTLTELAGVDRAVGARRGAADAPGRWAGLIARDRAHRTLTEGAAFVGLFLRVLVGCDLVVRVAIVVLLVLLQRVAGLVDRPIVVAVAVVLAQFRPDAPHRHRTCQADEAASGADDDAVE